MSAHQPVDIVGKYGSLAAFIKATDIGPNAGEPASWAPVVVHNAANGAQIQVSGPRLGRIELVKVDGDLDLPRGALAIEMTLEQARAVCIALAQLIEHQGSKLRGGK